VVAYWDSSALFPLIAQEASSETMRKIKESYKQIITWTLTPVEIQSAIARLERSGDLSESQSNQLFSAWKTLEACLHIVKDIESVKAKAVRILRTHPLKAADSLQLGSALLVKDIGRPLPFVTLDKRLAQAASKEGLAVKGLPDIEET
jgi:uncharacterized protein